MQTEDNIQQRSNCSCGFLDISDVTERQQSEISTSKIIQGACRVPSSLFTMTKACMNVASAASANNFKHGSYDRYLARLKGRGPLTTQPTNNVTPVKGNKSRMIGLMPNCTKSYFCGGN